MRTQDSSPVRGFLAMPIPPMQKDCVESWLNDHFSCDHHGEGYFDGTRFCIFDPTGHNFPIPLANGVQLMIEFTNTDDDGTRAVASWFAHKA